MSTWKIASKEKLPADSVTVTSMKQDDASAYRQTPEIEVTALQIDEEFERDCDPYNRTGQFVKIKIKE